MQELLKSNAKINLFLEVLGKRKDGYSNINTVFTEIDLYDELNFTLTKNSEVSILSNIRTLNNKENLIYKVAIFIQNKYRVKYGVCVELKKNIPIAAGLAGGSTNAAATIKALSKLWKLNLSKQQMHEIAAEFGSDINFFLEGGTALGESRGEIITPLPDINIKNILLVNPKFGVSAGEAYALTDYGNKSWKDFYEKNDVKHCFNRLQKGITHKYPDIQKVIDKCFEFKAENSILSGSGPTVISFYEKYEQALIAKKYFDESGYWAIITENKRRT